MTWSVESPRVCESWSTTRKGTGSTIVRVCVVALLALPLAGCDDDPTGPSDGSVGSFTLETVSGEPLPVEQFVSSLVRPSGCDEQTLEESTLELRADGTFTISFMLHVVCAQSMEDRIVTFDGEFERRGMEVGFTTVSNIGFEGVFLTTVECPASGSSIVVRDEPFGFLLNYCDR